MSMTRRCSTDTVRPLGGGGATAKPAVRPAPTGPALDVWYFVMGRPPGPRRVAFPPAPGQRDLRTKSTDISPEKKERTPEPRATSGHVSDVGLALHALNEAREDTARADFVRTARRPRRTERGACLPSAPARELASTRRARICSGSVCGRASTFDHTGTRGALRVTFASAIASFSSAAS